MPDPQITTGWKESESKADVTVCLSAGVPLFLNKIRRGEFFMGQRGQGSSEEPVHRVVISEDLYIGVFPVTQEQFGVCTNMQGVKA